MASMNKKELETLILIMIFVIFAFFVLRIVFSKILGGVLNAP